MLCYVEYKVSVQTFSDSFLYFFLLGVLVAVGKCLRLKEGSQEVECIMIIVSTVHYAEENSRLGKHNLHYVNNKLVFNILAIFLD